MAIKYRAPQSEPDLTNIQPPDASLLPDIPAADGSDSNGPVASQTEGTAAVPTAPLALLTDSAPLTTTSSSIVISTPTLTPTTTASITSSATPTHTAAASPGLSSARLTAAIVVPIGIIAILIPIVTLWFLSHRRRLHERRYASQRTSHSHSPMIQKQPLMKGTPPSRPQRTPSEDNSPSHVIQHPPASQPRESLGLFNFELSPTTSTSRGSPPGSRGSLTSPRFRFSVARALEIRRSQASVVQPHARTSDSREPAQSSTGDTLRPHTGGSNRASRNSIFDPPPPYASPRPSEVAAARSHFAPLSRIGTRNLADRSLPRTAPPNNSGLDAEDRSTYVFSDAIQDPNTYGRVRTRSSSPSLEWPSPPQTQGVVARKPVPAQVHRVTSRQTSPQTASHLNGPFSSYLPERLSDVSGFSIDTSQWDDDRPRHESNVFSISPMDNDTSTIHPHHMI